MWAELDPAQKKKQKNNKVEKIKNVYA